MDDQFLAWIDLVADTFPDGEIVESDPLVEDRETLIEEEHADALAHYYESLTWNL
jgi:hypothetical protein